MSVLTSWLATHLVQAAAGTNATADDNGKNKNKESNTYTNEGHLVDRSAAVKAVVDRHKQQLQRAALVSLLHSW